MPASTTQDDETVAGRQEAKKAPWGHPSGLPHRWMVGVGFLVLISLTLQYGFHLGARAMDWLDWLDVALALCFGMDLAIPLVRSEDRRKVFRSRRLEYLLLAVSVLSLVAVAWVLPEAALSELLQALQIESMAKLFLAAVQLFLLLNLSIQVLRAAQRVLATGIRPELLLAGSFAALILIGALLLLMPKVSASADKPISLIDALFTSTSAACVTGLTVRDTGTDFSTLGQMIVMGLFQVGGLGIITFVAVISVFSSKSPSIPQMVALQEIVSARGLSDVKRQILAIILAAALIECVGAVCLYLCLPVESGWLFRVKWGVFHSISAFCNAGFSLQTDSLASYKADGAMTVTFMALIVLGGLGFLVIRDVVGFRMSTLPMFRKGGFIRRFHSGRISSRLSVQTKLSLVVTAALLVVGMLGFSLLESGHILRDKTASEQVLIAVFQSVTARTAGFNSVPIHELRDATLILLMSLMVIGACPVSTGGGIKTVTFGVLLLTLRSMLTGRERVEAFGRTLPRKVLFAALSVFVVYVMVAVTATFLLSLTDPQMAFQDQTFEVVSALSTVGLSTGMTSDLSTGGKLVLCLAMFIGRVGPLSVVMSVFRSGTSEDYEFPEEEVVVG